MFSSCHDVLDTFLYTVCCCFMHMIDTLTVILCHHSSLPTICLLLATVPAHNYSIHSAVFILHSHLATIFLVKRPDKLTGGHFWLFIWQNYQNPLQNCHFDTRHGPTIPYPDLRTAMVSEGSY